MNEPYQHSIPLTAEHAERFGQLLGLVMATCAEALSEKTGLSAEFFLARFTRPSALDALELEFFRHLAMGASEAIAAVNAGGWLIEATNRSLRRVAEILDTMDAADPLR